MTLKMVLQTTSTNHLPVAGIILAAGESSRMGRDKALLPLGTQTFVERLLGVLAGAPNPTMTPVVIVLGHHADEIERQITPALQQTTQARVVRNPHYKLGQLSSLQAALRALAEDEVSGAVVCLVDHPAVTRRVLEQMLARFAATNAPVIIPTFQGRRGHPVLFAARLFSELLAAPVDEGARVVVRQHAEELEFVETDEEAILWDIDRPEDYDMLLRRWSR